MAKSRTRSARRDSRVVPIDLAAKLLGRDHDDIKQLVVHRILSRVDDSADVSGIRLEEILRIRREFWASLAELATQFIEAVEQETLALTLEEAGIRS